MRAGLPGHLFTPVLWDRLHAVVTVDPGLVLDDFTTPRAHAALASTEILITGWGCPLIDRAVLDLAPRLRAIMHTAGSVKGHVTPACWTRGIAVSTAAAANALPVAEYTLAAILQAGKGIRELELAYRTRRGQVDLLTGYPGIGTYQRTVGVVGASRIGRRVIELLRPFDLSVALYDPYVSRAEARDLGVRPVSLPELLAGCDIVTLHAPSLPETRHMIDAAGLALLRDGATLINTARGALIDQDALVVELTTGRINAVIDVTEPEILPADSPLYDLPNVVLTPHIAGAWGVELHRLADFAVDEVRRHVAGLPPRHPVALEELTRIA
jgi:phosphoglycerate dehydrogenase-like enzyme